MRIKFSGAPKELVDYTDDELNEEWNELDYVNQTDQGDTGSIQRQDEVEKEMNRREGQGSKSTFPGVQAGVTTGGGKVEVFIVDAESGHYKDSEKTGGVVRKKFAEVSGNPELADDFVFYKLSVGEVRQMFVEKLQREPTEEELQMAVKNVENGMSEYFPDIIQIAVDVAAANEMGF